MSAILLGKWKAKLEAQLDAEELSDEEYEELKQLRREAKQLRMETEILKRRLLCERNEVKFNFIKSESSFYPVSVLCRVMKVSRSAYYYD